MGGFIYQNIPPPIKQNALFQRGGKGMGYPSMPSGHFFLIRLHERSYNYLNGNCVCSFVRIFVYNKNEKNHDIFKSISKS